MALDEFIASALRRDGVAHALPDEVAVTFVVQGPGGGTWTARRVGDRMDVRTGDDPEADCRLFCDVDDFVALVGGGLDGRRGFLEGRIRVEGDVGLVLGLQTALGR